MTSCNLRAIATAIAVVCFTGLVTPSLARDESVGSSKVPELDMQPGCGATASEDLDLANNKPTVQSCLSEEQAARHTLDGAWSTFSANDRRACTTATQAGGPPSYINLLWCLKDARLARQLEQKPNRGAHASLQ